MSFLTFSGITKRFPGVLALDGVGFGVERGTCHALIGENGAGKSTLGKILAGVQTADSGEIRLDGRVIRPASPLAARGLGIAMVHQELAFCPNLSVAENLCLGDLPRRAGFVDRAELLARAHAMLATIGADLDPATLIGTLSTGREQLVQIAAAVGTGARVIVMDEPSSSLSAAETAELFRLVRGLKARGITLLYVSHRLEELFALCDHITVLRDGRHVATESVAATDPQRVVTQMIGRELLPRTPAHLRQEPGPSRLRVQGLSSGRLFHDISLEVRAGEIVGVAGLMGSGRSRLIHTVAGAQPATGGDMAVDGMRYAPRSPGDGTAAGLVLIPEDRKEQALVLFAPIKDNITVSILRALSTRTLLTPKRQREAAQAAAANVRVRMQSVDQPVGSLSGGNQQRSVFGRAFSTRPRLLLLDEPTRGVDVGAKAEIYGLIERAAGDGMAVLVASSELEELLLICHRIAVMNHGEIAAMLPHQDATKERIMSAAAGTAQVSAAAAAAVPTPAPRGGA